MLSDHPQFQTQANTTNTILLRLLEGQTRQTDSFLSVIRELEASLETANQRQHVQGMNESSGTDPFEPSRQKPRGQVLSETIVDEDGPQHDWRVKFMKDDAEDMSASRKISDQSDEAYAAIDNRILHPPQNRRMEPRTRDWTTRILQEFNISCGEVILELQDLVHQHDDKAREAAWPSEVLRIELLKLAYKSDDILELPDRYASDRLNFLLTSTSMNDLYLAVASFRSSLYSKVHAFHFRKLDQWCEVLEKLLRTLQETASRDSRNSSNFYTSGLSDLIASMYGTKYELQEFKSRTYPRRFNSRCQETIAELVHLENHYKRVGDDLKVSSASKELRKALYDYSSTLAQVFGYSAEHGVEVMPDARKAVKALHTTVDKLHSCLNSSKHAFYFRELSQWCSVLEHLREVDYGDNLDGFIRNYVNDHIPHMQVAMGHVIKELQVFRDRSLPFVLTEEKERATTRYINITTIATFFSSVTATTLQYSLQKTGSSLAALVNFFWFISLVFSVSSGVSSLLGMTWRRSSIYKLGSPPALMSFWLVKGPMVFLIIAAVSFIIGLNLLSFLYSLPLYVSFTTSIFTGFHALSLVIVVLWFFCKLRPDRKWTIWVTVRGRQTQSFLASAAALLVSILSWVQTTILRMWIVHVLAGIVFIFAAMAKIALLGLITLLGKLVAPPWHRISRRLVKGWSHNLLYGKNPNLRRNIYWALGMDNRVIALNCSMATEQTWPEPFFLARIFRYRNKLQNAISRKIDEGMNYLDAIDRSYISGTQRFARGRMKQDPESRVSVHSGGVLSQNKKDVSRPAYRRSLELRFGQGQSVDTILDSIENFEQKICVGRVDFESFKNYLKGLLWGYPELFQEYFEDYYPNTGPINLGEKLIRENTSPLGEDLVFGDGHSEIRMGTVADRVVALKVMKFIGITETSRATLNLFCRDVLLRKDINHRNVINICGITPAARSNTFSIIYPWMGGGNVLDYLRVRYLAGDSMDRLSLVKDVASGMAHLHGLDPTVTHGNLRSSNVLIDAEGTPKITDYGYNALVQNISEQYIQLWSYEQHSLRWKAPELLDLDSQSASESRSTKSGDVYAFACLCIEVFTGEPPFSHLRDSQVKDEVIHKKPTIPQAKLSFPDSGPHEQRLVSSAEMLVLEP